jgi:hypothetical protein
MPWQRENHARSKRPAADTAVTRLRLGGQAMPQFPLTSLAWPPSSRPPQRILPHARCPVDGDAGESPLQGGGPCRDHQPQGMHQRRTVRSPACHLLAFELELCRSGTPRSGGVQVRPGLTQSGSHDSSAARTKEFGSLAGPAQRKGGAISSPDRHGPGGGPTRLRPGPLAFSTAWSHKAPPRRGCWPPSGRSWRAARYT